MNTVFNLFGSASYDPELTFNKIKEVHTFIHVTLANNRGVCENIWSLYHALIDFKLKMSGKEGALSAKVYSGDLQSCIDDIIDIVARQYLPLKNLVQDASLEVISCKSDSSYIFNLKNKEKSRQEFTWFDLNGKYAPFDNISVSIEDVDIAQDKLECLDYIKNNNIDNADGIKELYFSLVTRIKYISNESRLNLPMYIELKILCEVYNDLNNCLRDYMSASTTHAGRGKKRSSPTNLKKHLEKDIYTLLSREKSCVGSMKGLFPNEVFVDPAIMRGADYILASQKNKSDEFIHLDEIESAEIVRDNSRVV